MIIPELEACGSWLEYPTPAMGAASADPHIYPWQSHHSAKLKQLTYQATELPTTATAAATRTVVLHQVEANGPSQREESWPQGCG